MNQPTSLAEPAVNGGRTLSRPPSARRVLDRIGGQNLGLLIALALLVAYLSARTDAFFAASNFMNIGQAISIIGVLAAMQTVVIISGGLDISVGSAAGLSSISAALLVSHTGSPMLGILGGLCAGLAAGVFNAIVITSFRVNPVIATLATLSGFKGVAYLLSNGSAVSVTNATFNTIGSGRVAGIPVPVLILAGVALALHVLLRYTDIGRNIYALGGNQVAARLSGIPLDRYRIGIYAASGLVAGIAGIVLTGKTLSGQPASGSEGLELEAITGALLGGAALTGGKGTIMGTVLAVLLLGTLTNGMILLNIQSFWQLVAKGMLLVIAVVIQQWRTRDVRSAQGLFT